jgi:sugar phosphate isomerase/epimerase
MSRREALKLTAAGALALAAGRPTARAKEKRIRVALQLYSVRGDCGKDFDRALEEVAKIGFKGVEFAGYRKYGNRARDLRKRLDDLGLIAAGTHIGTGSFRGGALARTIDFHKTIGCKYLIVPGDGSFTHPERSKALAETFNKAAEVLKPHGMYCGYHNHTKEFKKVDGKTYWDLFAERTSKDVVLQQDVGWTVHAGLDPVEYIRKYPGRTGITHFKPTVARGDRDKKPIIGQDSVKWRDVITACHEVGGTEWFTIEQEKYLPGKSPMECSRLSFEGLKGILAEMEDVLNPKPKETSAPPKRPAPSAKDEGEKKAERLFKMARQAEKMGQRGAAASIYSKIVRDYPGTASAGQAQDRLKRLGR